MSQLRVVYTADENYAMPLAVSMRSLVDNTDSVDRLSVTVLTQHLTGDSVDRIRKSCPEIDPDIITVPEESFADLPTFGYYTATVYLRLLIPTLLPGDDPVVYLDADTVVLADVAELYGTPLAGRPVAAVEDPVSPRIDAPNGIQRWTELGVPGSTPYFNNGVMVIDPVRWRELDLTTDTIDYVRRYSDQILYLEQEAMNAILVGNWQRIDPAWNVWSPLVGAAIVAQRLGLKSYTVHPDHAPVLDSPKIVQFVGEDKPWFREAMGTPYGRLFYHYLDRTTWSGWRPE